MWRYVIGLFLIVFFVSTFAITFPNKPSGGIFYADQAGILSGSNKKQINRIASQLLKDKKIPIYVVTINSLADQAADTSNITQYALSLHNIWELGSKGNDKSVLLVVDKLDNTAAIQFGNDWDRSYVEQGAVILNKLVYPYIKSKDYAKGTIAGLISLDALLRDKALPNSFSLDAAINSNVELMVDYSKWLLLAGLLCIVGLIVWRRFKH